MKPACRELLRHPATRVSALVCAAAAMLMLAGQASAQPGVSASIYSQARLRGLPVSDGQPVAGMELSYDLANGLYLGGTASVVATRHSGLRPLAFEEYVGFSHGIGQALALDVGIMHRGYTEYWGRGPAASYTEAYVGLIGEHLSGHIFLSPGYFDKNRPTVYAEIDADSDLGGNWRLYGHAGLLGRLRSHAYYGEDETIDWRVGVRRRIGRVELDAAWTGHGATTGPYGAREKGDGAIVAGLVIGL